MKCNDFITLYQHNVMLSCVYNNIVYFLCCYIYKSIIFDSDLSLYQHSISYDVVILLYQHLYNVELSI